MDHKRKGFTLVELLVVIAIIAILTIITVSQFSTAKAKARDVARKGDLDSVSKALLMFYNDYGRFPNTVINASDPDINVLLSSGSEFKDTSGYSYMKVMPKENYASTTIYPYCYQVSADGKKFGLFSNLENNKDSDFRKYTSPTTPYKCNGTTNNYDFVIISPNASIKNSDGTLQ